MYEHRADSHLIIGHTGLQIPDCFPFRPTPYVDFTVCSLNNVVAYKHNWAFKLFIKSQIFYDNVRKKKIYCH